MRKTEMKSLKEARETIEYNFRNEVEIEEIDFGTQKMLFRVNFDGSQMADFWSEDEAKKFVASVEWRVYQLDDSRFQAEYWNSQKAEWVDWGEGFRE
jgi:hypothetical protein